MIKLFTHTDLDGVGCAVLAKIAFGDNVDISYCNYNEIDDYVSQFIHADSGYGIVHVTDISVSSETAEVINNADINITLLDHHATALALNRYSWCRVEVSGENGMKTSGTEMYYQHLVQSGCLKQTAALDGFSNLIRDYDTWRWSELGEDGLICKKVNDLLYLYGREMFIDWCISEIRTGEFPTLHFEDEVVLRVKQREIDAYIDAKEAKMWTKNVLGYTCGVVFADKHFSELGNKICQRHPEIDFCAMIDMDGTISYRTVRDDINLGADIAKMFGGGGHAKAAGSRFSDEIIINLIIGLFQSN